MPSKRKAQNMPAASESPSKRVTRADVASGTAPEPADITNVEDTSPIRKRRRRIDNESNTEHDDEPEISKPKPTRVYGRRATTKPVIAHAELDATVLLTDIDERPDADEPKLKTHADESKKNVDTPRRSRRRVVFDSIELPHSPTWTNWNTVAEREASPTPIHATPLSTVKKPKAKPKPSMGSEHPVSTPNRSKVSIASTKTRIPLPECLPMHLHKYLNLQKRAILDAFSYAPLIDHQNETSEDNDSEPAANIIALQQLRDLLGGSIERGEGNSCLVIGPAGSGKSKIFESVLTEFEDEHKPIVIRLNGYVQHTDRLAMREIARQVVEQTGSKQFESIGTEDDNPFDDGEAGEIVGGLPPPSHLPSLITALPTLSRPVVVLLDAFHIFTEQARQALLYCLLDTVQSCRAGSSSNRGLAVIGITSRIDVVNLLEKRVKSRFSHRMLRTASMRRIDEWMAVLEVCLKSKIREEGPAGDEWSTIWEHSVALFLQDRPVSEIVRDMFGISKDVRSLIKAMTSAIIRLNPSSPYLTALHLRKGLDSQRSKPHYSLLTKLNYPSLSLCIAAQHVRTAGHDFFTFEMLYELFTIQVRTSSAAPVMLGGGSIGMVSVGRRILMGAFEELVHMKLFVQAGSASVNIGKEFIKHRCTVGREDVKTAVDRIGQTNLKKWFSKAQ